MENMRIVKTNEGKYVFTERECEIIEKYFDSIRVFMDDVIVDKVVSEIPYNDEYDVISLVAHYDSYLLEKDYEEEIEFSQIMFNEFGVDI